MRNVIVTSGGKDPVVPGGVQTTVHGAKGEAARWGTFAIVCSRIHLRVNQGGLTWSHVCGCWRYEMVLR